MTTEAGRQCIFELFEFCGQTERESERLRINLCLHNEFEPYTAFNRIKRIDKKKQIITMSDMKDYLMDNHVYSDIVDISKLFRHFSSLDNDCDFLTYEDFLQIVMPFSDSLLRSTVSLRRPIELDKNSQMNQYVETSLSNLLIYEINRAVGLAHLIEQPLPQSTRDFFRYLSMDIDGYIDFDCIKRFYSHYNNLKFDDDLVLVLRRIDRSGKGNISYKHFCRFMGEAVNSKNGVETKIPARVLKIQIQNNQLNQKKSAIDQSQMISVLDSERQFKEVSNQEVAFEKSYIRESNNELREQIQSRSNGKAQFKTPVQSAKPGYNSTLNSSMEKQMRTTLNLSTQAATPDRSQNSFYKQSVKFTTDCFDDRGTSANKKKNVQEDIFSSEIKPTLVVQKPQAYNPWINTKIRSASCASQEECMSKQPVSAKKPTQIKNKSEFVKIYIPENRQYLPNRLELYQQIPEYGIRQNLMIDQVLQSIQSLIFMDFEVDYYQEDLDVINNFDFLSSQFQFSDKNYTSLTEFEFAVQKITENKEISKDEIYLLFKRFDSDKDGRLSKKQIFYMLSPVNLDEKDVQTTYSQAELNKKIKNLLNQMIENEMTAENIKKRLRNKEKIDLNRLFGDIDFDQDHYLNQNDIYQYFITEGNGNFQESDFKFIINFLSMDCNQKAGVKFGDFVQKLSPSLFD